MENYDERIFMRWMCGSGAARTHARDVCVCVCMGGCTLNALRAMI